MPDSDKAKTKANVENVGLKTKAKDNNNTAASLKSYLRKLLLYFRSVINIAISLSKKGVADYEYDDDNDDDDKML